MSEELKSESQSQKTPEHELVELLQQSRVKPSGFKPTVPTILGNKFGHEALMVKPRPVVNWLAVAIGIMTVVLVFGTGYFLLSSLRLSRGEITFELNENQVTLQVDGKSFGAIDTGYVAKLPAGTHKLVLAKDGFLELHQTMEVVRGEKSTASFQLLPIPSIEKVLENTVKFVGLGRDGTEIVYFDSADNLFKSFQLVENKAIDLFRGDFPDVTDAVWAPVGQSAIVKMAGRHNFPLMVDNRGVRGRYVVLGERPEQGKANYNGTTTWLFDDARRTAAGWGPVLLTESVRQVTFSPSGGEIAYIYSTADGEYSLVIALPDGQEWERAVVDMPTLADSATLEWVNDEQHILVNNNDRLLLVDLIGKTVSEIANTRIPKSAYAMSPDGLRLAYMVDSTDGPRLAIYNNETSTATNVVIKELDPMAPMVWLSDGDLMMVAKNKTFVRLDTETKESILIPFVGTETEFGVSKLLYSLASRVLLLVTEKGIFMMKI